MARKTTTSKKTEKKAAATSVPEKKVKTAGPAKKVGKVSPKVTNEKKASVKKSAVKPGMVAAKAAPKKIMTKPVAAKKTVAKKAAVKKAAPTKAVAKKATVPAKAIAKKAVVKKVASKKALPKKAAPQKPVAQKAALKKAAPKKASPQKTVVKKVALKKAAPVKTSVTQAGTKKVAAKKKAPTMATPRTVVDLDQPTGMYNGIVLCEKVKPFPAKTPYTPKELEKLRDALREEQEQLVAALNSLKGASMDAFDISKDHPGYSIHMAEHATDLQTAETNLGVRSIESERMAQVEQALVRIQHNITRYGLCLACGAKIGIQRLIARPHAHLCMNCRTRYEDIRRRRGL